MTNPLKNQGIQSEKGLENRPIDLKWVLHDLKYLSPPSSAERDIFADTLLHFPAVSRLPEP